MPVVAYYLGRPARIWITAMSGSAGNIGEPGRHRTPASPRSASAGRRRTLKETSAPGATAVTTSPGEARAGN